MPLLLMFPTWRMCERRKWELKMQTPKQVYFYLFKLLRKSILQPAVEGSLEKSFEKPSIEQGVNNFVQYKFSHLPSKERQTTIELAKMFLNCINYRHLDAPSQRRLQSPNDDISGYKKTTQGACATAMYRSSVTAYLGTKPQRCLGEHCLLHLHHHEMTTLGTSQTGEGQTVP